MEKILVIDDDNKLIELLDEFLRSYNYDVVTKNLPEEGLKFLDNNTVDLIILDIMLPVMDGFKVLKEIRKTSTVPVIMLTAKITESDIIKGLDLGADDYVTKPFSPKELVSRVKAIFRRIDKQNLFAKKKILSLKNMQIDG